jgi:hypothetical protein
MLVDDASIPNPIDNTRGRRPTDNAMRLKNDAMNNKNEHDIDRVENKRQRLIKFPMIPKPKIGKPT